MAERTGMAGDYIDMGEVCEPSHATLGQNREIYSGVSRQCDEDVLSHSSVESARLEFNHILTSTADAFRPNLQLARRIEGTAGQTGPDGPGFCLRQIAKARNQVTGTVQSVVTNGNGGFNPRLEGLS